MPLRQPRAEDTCTARDDHVGPHTDQDADYGAGEPEEPRAGASGLGATSLPLPQPRSGGAFFWIEPGLD
jgi:hypothetical protein